jgi:hypothetical protein
MCSMVVKFFYEVTKEMTCQENFYTYYDEAPFFSIGIFFLFKGLGL